jgi:hypothetical protein
VAIVSCHWISSARAAALIPSPRTQLAASRPMSAMLVSMEPDARIRLRAS